MDWWLDKSLRRHKTAKLSTSGFNGDLSFTFVCTVVCIDHTIVVVQLDVRCRKGSNCYPLSVDLLEYIGNQIKTLETSIVNLRIQ